MQWYKAPRSMHYGDDVFKKEYVSQKIEKWVREIEELARIARMYPQAAYIAYTQGRQHQYTYLMRTVSNLETLMGLLEEAIRLEITPSTTKRVLLQ